MFPTIAFEPDDPTPFLSYVLRTSEYLEGEHKFVQSAIRRGYKIDIDQGEKPDLPKGGASDKVSKRDRQGNPKPQGTGSGNKEPLQRCKGCGNSPKLQLKFKLEPCDLVKGTCVNW